MSTSSPPTRRRSRWRTVVWVALWPLEKLAYVLQGGARFVKFLVIASNPLFLALWLMHRDTRRKGSDERH